MLILNLMLVATDPAPGPVKVFGDWAVACDNLRACEMTSLVGDDADIPEDGPLTASISRAAGPRGGFQLTVDSAKATGNLVLRIDANAVAHGVAKDRVVRFSGVEAGRIVAALANGKALSLAAGRTTVTAVSLQGSAAALRFIDASQGRAGTVTAAIAKGAKPANAVPTAPATPHVPALRAGGRATTVSAAMRQEMRKHADCEEESFHADQQAVDADALGGGATLALLPCGSGAYNIMSVPFIVRGGKAEVADLDYASDGTTLTNASWDAKTSTLSTHAKGRGIGDCGEDASYVWDGMRFRLVEFRRMDECRGSVNWLRTWKAEPDFR